jgi:hypothetical protein
MVVHGQSPCFEFPAAGLLPFTETTSLYQLANYFATQSKNKRKVCWPGATKLRNNRDD